MQTQQNPAGGPGMSLNSRQKYTSSGHGSQDAYGANALQGECQNIANAHGSRNDQLNISAFKIGTLVGAGVIDRTEAELQLADAARTAGLPEDEIKSTLKSGLDGGILSPREIETIRNETPITRRVAPATPPEQAFPSGMREPPPDFDAILARCGPAGQHQYLIDKLIGPCGVLQDGNQLVITLINEHGGRTGAQVVVPSGAKRYLKGTAKKGNFHPIGCEWNNPPDLLLEGHKLLICEGFATGATLHMATGNPVIVAFDDGNLTPVAETMLRLFPGAEIVICGDFDGNGAGQRAATKAAALTSATVALPVFTTEELTCPPGEKPPSDFNDLARLHGLEAVAEAVAGACHVNNSETPPAKKAAFMPQSAFQRHWDKIRPPRREWVIPVVVPTTRVGLCLGQGGSGKSWVMMLLAVSVASGHDFLGHSVESPGAVLILGGEDENAEAHRRMEQIINKLPMELQERAWKNIFFESRVSENSLITLLAANGEIERTEFLFGLIEAANSIPNLKLIILDPLSRFRGGEENASEDVTRFVEAAEFLAKSTNAAVILVHHANKNSAANGTGDDQHAARGSSALVDGVRFVINLVGMAKEEAKKYGIPEDQRRDYSRLSNSKNNYSRKFDDIWLLMRDGIQVVEFGLPGKNEDSNHDALEKIKSIIADKAMLGIRFTKRAFVDSFSGVGGPVGLAKNSLDLLIRESIAKGSLIAIRKKSQGGGEELFLPGESVQEDDTDEVF